MSNNRLWLIHRPSGEAVCLGSRTAVQWGVRNPVALGNAVHAFFDRVNDHGEDWSGRDDFVLALEDTERGAPGCVEIEGYSHTDDGLHPRLKK
jgi:hypothetical protein